jgi:hypothetical protein
MTGRTKRVAGRAAAEVVVTVLTGVAAAWGGVQIAVAATAV